MGENPGPDATVLVPAGAKVRLGFLGGTAVEVVDAVQGKISVMSFLK